MEYTTFGKTHCGQVNELRKQNLFYLVSLADLFESRFCFLPIQGILIRMPSHRQFVERPLEVIGSKSLAQLEDLVVIYPHLFETLVVGLTHV